MADEAFALSPISARAAQPSEEDYAAIHEAFMETSRGRWFLGEYAKRNRNADTRMVLDAVARIEGTLAAQKQAASDADLTEALAAIRKTVGEAQAAASDGLDGVAPEEQLAPIGRAVRIIREISWRWRETGADARICDILDSQTAAIEASTDRISMAEARAAIDRAFATIEARIDDYFPGDAMPAATGRRAEDANVVPFPAPAEEASPPEAATAADAIQTSAKAPVGERAEPPAEEAALPAIADSQAEAAMPLAEAVGAIEVVDETAADAHDEAVLDLIAAEMSAPQAMDDDILIGEAELAELRSSRSEIAEPVRDMAKPVAVVPARPLPRAAAAAPEPTQGCETEASIGSAVIASGMLKKQNAPANDPLAPIRRMTQAEKVAFFS